MAWCLVGAGVGHHNGHIIGAASFDHGNPVDCLAGDAPGSRQQPLTPAEVVLATSGPDKVLDAHMAERVLGKGVARVSRAAASMPAPVRGDSGNAVSTAVGTSRWVRSE